MKDEKKKTETTEVKEEVVAVEEKILDEDLEDATGGTFTVLGPGQKMWDPSMGKWRW